MSENTLPPLPTPSPAGAQRWRDPHRYLWLLSPFFALGAAWNLVNFWRSGAEFWLWLLPAVMYIVIPLVDALLGPDGRNPPDGSTAALEADNYYRAIVVAFIPFQFAATILGCALAASVPLSATGWLGLVLTVGGINGVAINTAHELGHKRPRWERWLSRITLAPVAYGHFYVEHNRGHHLRVATPEDPASARMGESFWAFLPRTMLGSVRSAWHIESTSLAARGLPAWHWRNEVLQAWGMTTVLFGALAWAFGPKVLVFLAVQAFYGASLLEVVNYIEHYGLLRAKRADGRREPCDVTHSWNTSHVLSNLFLYQLQRHSDHHAHPGRRYQALRHFAESPQLPSGYPAMLLLAYVPPLWFRVMDRRVLAHYGGDVGRANLHPPRREALQARYPRPASRESV
ncbi:MAG TPA: alkane 1-monooxygenase [Ideonella sp.]|uniref:alkane 1-monooxygenase n=1 Tax=Ideonella sp. TaxID=1929293 RepID=UPI002E2ECD12|nr:alkane 1-monooxygenase [Ideonella sp.]HEX5685585.1 alkane 1-monooxygenase [Ideonella sp.]